MIIVRLRGGLGNQMFQYAFGRHLSLERRTKLKIDASFCSKGENRPYYMDMFDLPVDIASEKEIASCSAPSLSWRLRRKAECITRRRVRSWIPVIKERGDGFDENKLFLPDGVLLDGYWQSEKYFLKNVDVIQSDFAQQESMITNLPFLREIEATESVGIHIRRGDYVSVDAANSILGTCDLSYYVNAIRLFRDRLRNPHFYIFSDDVNWVRRNLGSFGLCTVVEFSGIDRVCADFNALRKCKHHIISNSTFSWWAAYLNSNAEKIVVAPSPWFKDSDYCSDYIVPTSWISLSRRFD